MTSGIPYSFVPGTKAKADEVNANFLAVLNKIEETNSAKLNVDLSNIDETGKSTLDSKANNSDIDGKWQFCHYIIVDGVSLNGTSALTYDLSPYLPKDENLYEVLLSARVITTNTNGAYIAALLKSSLMSNNVYLCNARSRTSLNSTGAGSSIIPLGEDKKLYIARTEEYNGQLVLTIDGYRKAR